MQATRQILSAVLVFTILLSGLPLFSPEDANRDSRMDLGDAILNVMDLARTIEEPGEFTASMAKALSTLHLLAGLKTVIKGEGTAKSNVTSSSLDLPCLITALSFLNPSTSYYRVFEKNLSYHSLILTPSSPPPRTGSIS